MSDTDDSYTDYEYSSYDEYDSDSGIAPDAFNEEIATPTKPNDYEVFLLSDNRYKKYDQFLYIDHIHHVKKLKILRLISVYQL